MQLTFSRASLLRSLHLFLLLVALFVGATIYLLWFGGGHGPKRALGMVLMPVCGLLSLFIVGKTLWLIQANIPAARIMPDGIEVQSFVNRKVVSWSQLSDVRLSDVSVGKTTVPTVEIQRRTGHSVRLAVSLLCESSVDVEAWIAAARSKLAGAVT